MPRQHLNWLRFALENHDKSRSKQQLLPIYYFFEFRYDDKSMKSSPKREISLLLGTAFCLYAISSKTWFCDIQTLFGAPLCGTIDTEAVIRFFVRCYLLTEAIS